MASQKVDLCYKDVATREIKVGHIVCYAALLGRCAVLHFGRVTKLSTRHDGFRGGSKSTIRVLGVKVDASGAWHLMKKGQPFTLAFFDRLLVVPDELVPEPALHLLRQTQLAEMGVTDD